MKTKKIIGCVFFIFLFCESFAEEKIGSFVVDSFASSEVRTVLATAKGRNLSLSYECAITKSSVREKTLKLLVNDISTTLFDSVAVVEYHIEGISDRFLDNDVSLYTTRPPGWDVDYISNSIDATDLVFIEDLSEAKEVILSITFLDSLKNQKMVFSVTGRIDVSGFSSVINTVNSRCSFI